MECLTPPFKSYPLNPENLEVPFSPYGQWTLTLESRFSITPLKSSEFLTIKSSIWSPTKINSTSLIEADNFLNIICLSTNPQNQPLPLTKGGRTHA